MIQATLCYLIKKSNKQINEICLAIKKRGYGVNKWNGVGGKLNQSETIEQALLRESQEEINVKLVNYYKVAELNIKNIDQPHWNQRVHVFFATKWQGNPSESEEMRPRWFKLSELPYKEMWQKDTEWLPCVLKGNFLRAHFTCDNDEVLIKRKLEFVKELVI